MRRSIHVQMIIAGLLACPGGAVAQDLGAQLAELEVMRAQIVAMNARLRELEEQVQAHMRAPSAADQMKAPLAAAPSGPNRVSFAGDVRVRTESTDEEGAELRRRDRVRARAGVTAKVTESVTAGARVATGGRDPRTTNSTLTGENAKKDVGLDLAYLQIKTFQDMKVTAGKMENPLWRPRQSLFYSSEVNPEGVSINYGEGAGWFGQTSHYWLEERLADDDSAVLVGQLGWRWKTSTREQLTVALSYSDHQQVQHRKPFFEASNSYGNTVLTDGVLANDFDVLAIAAEWEDTVFLLPFSVFGEFAHNTAARELNLAAGVGASFGDASLPRGWQFSYQYEWLEKDALFAQAINADFSGGNTDTRGHMFKLAYGLAKNWSVNFTLMLSDLNMDVGEERRFSRAQIDVHAKY